MTDFIRYIRARPVPDVLLTAFLATTVLSIWLGIALEWYFLWAAPMLLLIAFVGIVDFRKLFFLLLFLIPLSTELYLPNGFATDFPTEPLIIGLLLIGTAWTLQRIPRLDLTLIGHPISMLVLLHLAWILFSTLSAELWSVSLKFFLAKLWYIGVFYFLSLHLLRRKEDLRQFFWLVFSSLLLTVVLTLIRHSAYNFSFQDVYRVLHPYQRNHVNYAASISLFIPFVWLGIRRYAQKTYLRYFLWIALGILLVGVYLSYTRAAYIALLIATGSYFVIRLGWLKYLIPAAALVALLALGYLANANRFMDLAPNYDRTISHTDFDNLIEATYKLEDISTMERVYRWVAGAYVAIDHPWTGVGPGNFVNFYRSYTLDAFRTYVSNNKEGSGVHSYYLMTLVEQGLPGLLIFLLLAAGSLIWGERVYHQTRDPEYQAVVMAALLCLIIIDSFLIINDLIETDKVGPFFFMSLAILVVVDKSNRNITSSLK